MGSDERLENSFCLPLVVEMLSLQKVAELLLSSRSAACETWSGVAGETWALSVDRRWLVLQLLVYFLGLLSLLLRWNGFTGILKAVVAQRGSRPPVT